MNVKPIETRYAGHRFRSRLEARWAVCFDHMRIPWEYEPQGYETSAGPYLPDFTLTLAPRQWGLVEFDSSLECICNMESSISGLCPYHNSGRSSPRRVFLEVKGDDRRGVAPDPRWVEMSNQLPFFVAFGIPRIEGPPENKFSDEWTAQSLDRVRPDGKVWTRQFFRDCPVCGGVDIDPNGVPELKDDLGLSAVGGGITSCCAVWRSEPGIQRAASTRMVAAYTAARSARFEHGESGP